MINTQKSSKVALDLEGFDLLNQLFEIDVGSCLIFIIKFECPEFLIRKTVKRDLPFCIGGPIFKYV